MKWRQGQRIESSQRLPLPQRYFVSEIVQVAVAVLLTFSGPTQAAGNVMASGPETDEVVAARAPVPENEHPGDNEPALPAAGTVKVAEVSCAPETVPVSVAWTLPSPASTTTGPETFEPV